MIKMALIFGFTRKTVFDWTTADLASGCIVTSDGLSCFAGITDAGCQHRAIVADGRKPKDSPEFSWINTVLDKLRTSLGGAYHVSDFTTYRTRYLGAFVYPLNQRFHLEALPLRLFVAQPLSSLAQHVGCGKLKNFSSQKK